MRFIGALYNEERTEIKPGFTCESVEYLKKEKTTIIGRLEKVILDLKLIVFVSEEQVNVRNEQHRFGMITSSLPDITEAPFNAIFVIR